MPKLSIITINYNNANGLEKTIKSVVSQRFKDFEYLIIDGGSTDNSVAVVQQYKDSITYQISEPDRGIYHAMNKGIQKATGDYCLFLNSGDFLVDTNVLSEVFLQNFEEEIIYGDMMIDWANGKITLGKMPASITFYQMLTDTLWHPVSFIKKELFHKFGLYNEQYKLVADYDFFFKAIIMNGVSTRHFPIPISVFYIDGISSLPENKLLEKAEREMVLKSYLPQPVVDFANDYIKLKNENNKGVFFRLINKLRKI